MLGGRLETFSLTPSFLGSGNSFGMENHSVILPRHGLCTSLLSLGFSVTLQAEAPQGLLGAQGRCFLCGRVLPWPVSHCSSDNLYFYHPPALADPLFAPGAARPNLLLEGLDNLCSKGSPFFNPPFASSCVILISAVNIPSHGSVGGYLLCIQTIASWRKGSNIIHWEERLGWNPEQKQPLRRKDMWKHFHATVDIIKPCP